MPPLFDKDTNKVLSVSSKVFGVITVLVFILLIGVSQFLLSQRFIQAAHWVNHTHEVRTAISELLSVIQDAETGQRGYIITGHEEYLEPYIQAKASLSDTIKNLHLLTSDNPVQQKNMKDVKELISKKISELKETINLRNEGELAKVTDLINTNRGKLIMDDIRAILKDMDAEELRLLHHRQAKEDSERYYIYLTQSIIAVLFLISIIYLIKQARKNIKLQVQKENELHETRDKIEEEKDRQLERQRKITETILDSAANVIVTLDINGRFVQFNRAAEKLTGYSAEEVIGEPVWDFFIPEEQLESVKSVFASLRDGDVDIDREHENEWLTRNKERRLLQWNNSTLKNSEGLVSHIISLGYDITDLREDEIESARIQKELQQAQKMESLGQLTGGIAHDFNNLLGIISGYAELSYERVKTNGDTKTAGYMHNIIQAGTRSIDLVSQMLLFSRVDNQNDEPQDIFSLVNDDLNLLRSTLPTSIEIESKLSSDIPRVVINPIKLNQIIMNLCINARDAMDSEGKLTITLQFLKDINYKSTVSYKPIIGDWIELSIRDTGEGINPDIIANIFEPFFTTKGVGEGTGMGLSVIYRIVEHYRGHIIVESELGGGTVFRLFFPPSEDEFDSCSNDEIELKDIPKGDGSEILFVDDEPMLSFQMSEFLGMHNYKVTVANDGKEAFELFKEKPDRFSMLITDQTMPRMTGLELIKNIRKINPELPTIMCSGYSSKIDANIATEMNIVFFQKPVKFNTLLMKVYNMLNSK